MALDRINATALLDGGVTTADIADDAVTTAKLATQTGNVDFADGGRIRLGDSQDLQIYHNGNNSYIDDTGTGNLYIRASDTVRLQSATGEQGVIVTTDGAVTLYHDNGAKIATTSTGVNVTGTVTADDIAISDTSPTFTMTDTDTNALFRVSASSAVGSVTLEVDENGVGSNPQFLIQGQNVNRFKIDADGGDIAFYADNGTTQGLLWDASTQRLGLGNAVPQKLLHLQESGGATARFQSTGVRVWDIGNDSTSFVIDDVTAGQERLRINSSGAVLIANTSGSLSDTGHSFYSHGIAYHTADSNAPLYINRKTTDGALVFFYRDNNQGSISISGTTVSYNGGHLARWSQLADGTKDTNIVKGTVLTNLDQMAVWHHEAVAATYYVEGDELPEITPATYYTEDDTLPEGVSVGDEKTAAVYAQIGDEKTPAADAYTEDNEQLNCMGVSSVEGDPNVAGVFVNWDNDDDEFNDMNIAMTGDMVIRIAQGTTVARGDLLMSAGDGTAKPQGDDIVRSKTIAKVTSTNVSHTYDDGSYLVPCVLMAC